MKNIRSGTTSHSWKFECFHYTDENFYGIHWKRVNFLFILLFTGQCAFLTSYLTPPYKTWTSWRRCPRDKTACQTCFRFDALTELGAFMRTKFLCISVLRVASGPRVKLASCKSALNPLVVCSTDRSKAVVPVLVLLFVALWFILRGDLLYVFLCVILFLCFSVLLVLRLPRLGKRELILVLFVRLFGLCLFRFVGFLFLLGSGKGCGLWLWHFLDFSLTFFSPCKCKIYISSIESDVYNKKKIQMFVVNMTFISTCEEKNMYISFVPSVVMKYTFFHFTRWNKSHIHSKHLNTLYIYVNAVHSYVEDTRIFHY